jgi:hypothetical protein
VVIVDVVENCCADTSVTACVVVGSVGPVKKRATPPDVADTVYRSPVPGMTAEPRSDAVPLLSATAAPPAWAFATYLRPVLKGSGGGVAVEKYV